MIKSALTVVVVSCMALLGWQCSKKERQPEPNGDSVQNYFSEICLFDEITGYRNRIVKWQEDITVFVMNDTLQYMREEMKLIIEELNQLITPSKISVTNRMDNANVIVYYGSAKEYAKTVATGGQNVPPGVEGFFRINWNALYHIYKGTVLVDVTQAKSPEERRHILREELTQALGLTNDSDRYPESIFFNGESAVTSYTRLDKEIIRLLYSEKITAGMDATEVKEALQ